ncbi:MAG: DUF883 domain-containing protein [Alcaligenaceae bacterium]|nr:MAG: DUF883 domain-containing protein [Alcaligenaceae bacterium]
MSTLDQRQEVLAQKERVAATFRELLASTEDLLKATASYTGSEIEEVRAKLKVQVEQARVHAHDMEGVAAQKYREATQATEAYVQQNVWKSIGIAALIGVLFGSLATSGGGSRDRE